MSRGAARLRDAHVARPSDPGLAAPQRSPMPTPSGPPPTPTTPRPTYRAPGSRPQVDKAQGAVAAPPLSPPGRSRASSRPSRSTPRPRPAARRPATDEPSPSQAGPRRHQGVRCRSRAPAGPQRPARLPDQVDDRLPSRPIPFGLRVRVAPPPPPPTPPPRGGRPARHGLSRRSPAPRSATATSSRRCGSVATGPRIRCNFPTR